MVLLPSFMYLAGWVWLLVPAAAVPETSVSTANADDVAKRETASEAITRRKRNAS